MRQGDGSDFLDAGDPRSAEIGIVYVESMDSRQEVLNALYLLNGQGRKQIVLDLSNALKIFRQPVDFDGLKQTRRDLKAELIVIAPSGPGPAEFARSRRFPVYSSLDSLKTFLTEAMSSAHTPHSQTGSPKKPGLLAFGSRKSYPGRVQPTTTTAPTPFPQQARPVPPTPQQQGSPFSPLPSMAPTPQQQQGSPLRPMAPTPRPQQSQGQPSVPGPLIPPTPQLQEQPFSPLPPTPVDPRKAATFGNNQQVTRGPQDDDDLLYAPSAYQTGPSMPQTNQPSAHVPPATQPPQLGDMPATPIKKGRASKPIAGQPENRPIPGAIIFPGGSTTSRANPDAAPSTPIRGSGTLRKNQNQPNIPAPQPPQNIPNQQQASGPVPVVPLYMPGSQQASGQVPAMPDPQPPKNMPGPPYQASGQVPSVPQNMPGPPQRGGTGKIAAVGAAGFGANLASGSMPTAPQNMPSPPQRGGTGKIAAVDATGAVMATGAAIGGPGNPGAPLRLVPPGPGAPPPGPRQTSLTPLPPPRASRGNRSGKGRLLLVGLLILLLLVLVGGVWASNTKGNFSSILPGSHVSAKVTLTPASRMEQNNYIITALPNGTTDNARRQVPARVLNTTSAPQTATGNATGSINATTASGTLIFLNGTISGVTLGTTTLTGKDGVQIKFNGPVFVPATGSASATVTAYAVNSGSGGNISAGDITGQCCSTGITVKNQSGFSGGQDAVPNSVIQQSDIDGAANPLVATLAQSTQVSLQKQVKVTEKMVDGSFACKPTTTADQQVGDRVKQVHVSVTVACHEEVYDALAAHQMAVSLLLGQAQNDPALTPNAQYALVGQITPRVLSDSVVSADGKVNLEMQAQGLWVYQFTPQMQQNIKGKIIKITQKSAMDVLLHQSGVASATIDLSSGTTMPATVNDITLTVLTLPAAQTTPTTGPGTPTIGPGGSNNGTPGGSNNGTPGGPNTNPTPTAVNGLGGS